jgi:hypothetical protein
MGFQEIAVLTLLAALILGCAVLAYLFLGSSRDRDGS